MPETSWLRLRSAGAPEAPLSGAREGPRAAPSSGQPRPLTSRVGRARGPAQALFLTWRVTHTALRNERVEPSVQRAAGTRRGCDRPAA
eukprot:scaffold29029_cov54-Phaeocystis_antarctica.AAC.2